MESVARVYKHSEGCQNCYAFFPDKRYGRDTSVVVRNKSGFNHLTPDIEGEVPDILRMRVEKLKDV